MDDNQMDNQNENVADENVAAPLRDEQVTQSRRLTESIAFGTLALLGGGLLALLSLTNIDWFYPTLFYATVVFVAWRRYF